MRIVILPHKFINVELYDGKLETKSVLTGSMSECIMKTQLKEGSEWVKVNELMKIQTARSVCISFTVNIILQAAFFAWSGSGLLQYTKYYEMLERAIWYINTTL